MTMQTTYVCDGCGKLLSDDELSEQPFLRIENPLTSITVHYHDEQCVTAVMAYAYAELTKRTAQFKGVYRK